jgi:ABC-type nitrate/sulfonate/bicarbonate transport system permease component
MRAPERWWNSASIGLLLPIALLLMWQALGTAVGTPRTPLPVNIVKAAATMIASGDLPAALLQSLGRVFGGFLLAATLAIPLGLLMGYSRPLERNLDPVVETFRPIAAIAILPLAILWLGTGTSAAVAIVAYAAFFPLIVNAVRARRTSIPRCCGPPQPWGLDRMTTIRTVVIPCGVAIDRRRLAHRDGRGLDRHRRGRARGRRQSRRVADPAASVR